MKARFKKATKKEESNKTYREQEEETFSSQEIGLANAPLFFPAGFEKLFITVYFILLPYVTGLIFLFVYVAKRDMEKFLSLNEESSFILTWAIGYEILAVLSIMYIVKMSISFATKKGNRHKKFKPPV